MAASSQDFSSSESNGGWSKVAKDLLKESQDDSDETAKCDACRSDSNSGCSDGSHSDSEPKRHNVYQDCGDDASMPPRTRSWWAELIKCYTKDEFGMLPPSCNITVVSACSGICAEGEALKAGQGSF